MSKAHRRWIQGAGVMLVTLTGLGFVAPSAEAGDTKQPEVILPLGHSDTIHSMALSWDEKQLLTGANDRAAILWDVETGKPIHFFRGHLAGITSVSMSEGGKRVLTGASYAAILYDGATSKMLRTTHVKYSGPVEVHGALSRDGKRYVARSSDKAGVLCDTDTGKTLQTFNGLGSTSRLVLSADGKQVLAGVLGRAILWDADNGKILQTFKVDEKIQVYSAALSPDGKRVATGLSDKTAILWDVATGKALHTFNGHRYAVTSVALSRDGKRVLTAETQPNAAILWDGETGQELKRLQGSHVNFVNAVALSAAGDRAFTATGSQAIFWNCATGKPLRTFKPLVREIHQVALSGDGSKLLTNSLIHPLLLWDITAAKPLKSFNGQALPTATLSRDSKKVLVGVRDGTGTALLWESATGKLLHTFKGHGASVCSVALSGDGSRALCGTQSSGVAFPSAILWDTETGRQLRTFKVNTASFDTQVSLSNDGHRALTTARNTTLWDSSTGKQLRGLGGDVALAQTILSGDGKRVLTRLRYGGFPAEGDIQLLDSETGKVLQRFQERDDLLKVMALSDDNRQVFACSQKNVAVLWDTATGKQLAKFLAHSAPITQAVFGPRNKFLVTSSHDGTVRIWKPGRAQEVFGLLQSGDEWLFWTPEGYYSCSPNGENLIAWKIADESPLGYRIVSPEQFRKTFHRPDLFRHLLSELDLGKALAAADKERGRTPQVPVTIADASEPVVIIARPLRSGEIVKTDECEIAAKAVPRGDQYVAALQLFVDGQPYPGGRARFEPKAGEAIATWKVNLAPGKRRIHVIAESIKGSASRPAEIDIIREDEKDPPPTLHLLGVGITEYVKIKGGGVEYAADDAKRFIETQAKHGKNLYPPPETIALTDGKASREQILNALDDLRKKAAEAKNPVTIIFLAGHGMVNEPGGDCYFMAADSDPDRLLATAISGTILKDALKAIPGKRIVFLDACHSGAFAEKLYWEMKADDPGAVIICSSKRDEKSLQNNTKRGGYFTLAVVEGLSGSAAKDRNGDVNLQQLLAYVHNRVNSWSEGSQNPYASNDAVNRFGGLPLTRP